MKYRKIYSTYMNIPVVLYSNIYGLYSDINHLMLPKKGLAIGKSNINFTYIGRAKQLMCRKESIKINVHILNIKLIEFCVQANYLTFHIILMNNANQGNVKTTV